VYSDADSLSPGRENATVVYDGPKDQRDGHFALPDPIKISELPACEVVQLGSQTKKMSNFSMRTCPFAGKWRRSTLFFPSW